MDTESIIRFTYAPSGVCAKVMTFEIEQAEPKEDSKIIDVKIYGGCPGNANGLVQMLKNNKVSDVIVKLNGIICGNKDTSCPDQLSKALIEWLGENNGNN